MAEDNNKDTQSPSHTAAPAAEPELRAPDAAGNEEPVFFSLDARIVRLWRIQNLMLGGFILTSAVVGGGLLWTLSDTPKFVAPTAILVALALMALLAGWLPSRMFAAHKYRMNDVCLELRSGIIWRKSVLIPISRVQHLDLQRGPLERRLGLATLQVHTAGTRNAAHAIPGLDADVAVHLREQLAASANLVIQ